MSKVRTEAKMANKRSKRCEYCKLRLRCDEIMREVCEMSFVEGFEKGWRYRIKDMMKEEEV